jgi:hypothetical protein
MDNIIQGNPTKTFFIEMITRDISIKDAILDLLDNSIDGANIINPTSYQGLYIDITINKDEFIVKDNCGGFSLETAKRYAFRFGRPEDAPLSNGSVGRFGIGMKRALFKMGKKFEVETKTDKDHFQVKVDVDEWRKKTVSIIQNEKTTMVEDWDFTYENITSNKDLSEKGTFIKVTNLFSEVSDLFEDNEFKNSLKDDIERLLNFSLEKGIKITLNGQRLNSKDIKIFRGDSQPYFYEGEKDGVKFRIVAGLGEVGNPALSGWYIYCNDRLVLEADKTEMTGWGVGSIPKWHTTFVMFRGIVFLDADETIKLPLTTTKRGIDTASDVYKTVFPIIKEATISVVPFLKEITKLRDEANNYRELLAEKEDRISVVELKSINFIVQEHKKFISPNIDLDEIAQDIDKVHISYEISKEIANKARLHSKTKSFKDLGITTFNYYIKMEELDNE